MTELRRLDGTRTPRATGRPEGSAGALARTAAVAPAKPPAGDVFCEGCERTVPKVSTEFGRAHGPTLENVATARAEVDAALGRKAPRVSVIWTQGDAGPGSAVLDKLRLGVGSPGHLLISYLLPSGEQKVMNIAGAFLFEMAKFRASGKDLVNFFTPEQYFFDTHNWWDGNGQGGIFNTRMVEVRLEQESSLVTPEKCQELHEAYQEVQAAYERRDTTFALLINRVLNALDDVGLLPPTSHYPAPEGVAPAPVRPDDLAEDAAHPTPDQRTGNCGLWTTGPAQQVGVMDKRTMWPRLGLAYFYEHVTRNDPANVNVVRWERPEDVRPTFARDRSGLVSPRRLWRTFKYRDDMARQTDVVAEVPSGSRVLTARLTERGERRVREAAWGRKLSQVAQQYVAEREARAQR